MRFSIVIPTRNRADKLAHALRSATRQTLDDYEIVVSDNHSSDGTRGVIGTCATDRVRHIAPPHPMSMPAHWEFALEHARGDRVLILCDDDALLPNCLERLDRIASDAGNPDLIQFECFTYIYDDGVKAGAGATIRLPEVVAEQFRPIDTERSLKLAYWRQDGNMPKLLNCAVHRRLLDEVRRVSGRVFGHWAPDYAVGVRLLALSRSAVRAGPLAVWGENMASYGAGARRDPGVLRDFLGQHPEWTGAFVHSPFPHIVSLANVVYDTMEIARDELKLSERRFPVDPVRFRAQLIKDLSGYVQLDSANFSEQIGLVAADLRRVRWTRAISPAAWLGAASHWWSRRIEKSTARAYRRDRTPHREYGFPNIAQAAEFAGSIRRAA